LGVRRQRGLAPSCRATKGHDHTPGENFFFFELRQLQSVQKLTGDNGATWSRPNPGDISIFVIFFSKFELRQPKLDQKENLRQ